MAKIFSGHWFTKKGVQNKVMMSTDYEEVKNSTIKKMLENSSHGIIMNGDVIYEKLPNPKTGIYPGLSRSEYKKFCAKINTGRKFVTVGEYDTENEATKSLNNMQENLKLNKMSYNIFGKVTKGNKTVDEVVVG